ncbi:MAG: DNA methyltransferase [Tepidisphaeraceae bacterium]
MLLQIKPITVAVDHIPFPRPVEMLRSGARRMAGKSANRLSFPEVRRHVATLSRLIASERDGKLKQGDALVILIDRFRLRPVDLARELKCRANHLSEAYHVAKMFPTKTRRPDVPYTHYWMAMRTVRKFKQMKMSPTDVLSEIARHGFTQHRDVTRHFAAKLLRQENYRVMARSSPDLAGWELDRCYHTRFQSLLNVFPPQSIKLIWADPPYANYRRVADGRYAGGSKTRIACDNETATQAIAVTIDLLRDWGTKLTPGGVLLLWQAAGPLRQPIATAIDNHGWETEAVVVWDKRTVQPGNFECPYSVQTEWVWVLKRRGDHLRNHDNSSRSDILRFAPVWKTAETADHGHAFEKPDDLCRFMLGKHTFEGELVFEPFGCTGTMSVAAMGMNRRWVYAESHAENFHIGQSRVEAARVGVRRVG